MSLVFDIILILIAQPEKKQERFFFFSAFTILEYSLCSYFFYLNLRREFFRKILAGLYILFIVIAILSMIFPTNNSFDSIGAPIETLFVIVLAILFLYEQLSDTETAFKLASKSFWIIVAFLIYLSASLFLFVSTAYLSDNEQLTFWPIANVANIIKNVLFAVAFVKPSEQGLYNSSPELRKF